VKSVLAAAAHAGVKVIVTYNIKDFPLLERRKLLAAGRQRSGTARKICFLSTLCSLIPLADGVDWV
jgi:hypothetical protein